MTSVPEILLIKDDEPTRRVLQAMLTAEGYHVQEASTAAAGVLLATRRFADVIILDLSPRNDKATDVIRKVRHTNRTIPIIVLSDCPNEHDKITALDAGADDFVTKPVAMGELLARVRVALRRSAQASGRASFSIYRTGEIVVDLNKRRTDIAGSRVHLTRLEYRLLEILILHADHIVTHEQLLTEVWGLDHRSQVQHLRVYMLALRRKLEADPSRPRYLLTEPSVGYRLVTEHFPEAWKQVELSEPGHETKHWP
jgi:two-component system KDP operon response regulator KdpE